MLGRVSFPKIHSDIQRTLSLRNREQNIISNQISSQERLHELRLDPMAAAHGSRYASVLSRKVVYSEQNRKVYDGLQFAEGHIRQSVEILHRGRELAVTAANGTFTDFDRNVMASEIDQLIEELGVIANAQDADGQYIFGGARSNVAPFRLLRTVSNRMRKDVITQTEYVGSNQANIVEVSDNDLVPKSIPGSELLWTRNTLVTGNTDILNYTVAQDSEVTINDVVISLGQGDSVYAILNKINNSSASVNASIDAFTGILQLRGTNTEQMWISDETGTVMSDLGIINTTGRPPFNISGDAQVFEENLFDVLIRLRDSMFENDYQDTGGRVLASIDGAMSSTLDGLGKIGAITERLDIVYRRLEEKDIPNITKQLDTELAVDMTDIIVKWRQLLQAQQTAYQVSSQTMETSLLNYLR